MERRVNSKCRVAEDELCVCVTFRVTDTIRNYIKRRFILIFLLRKKSKLQQLRNILRTTVIIVPAYVVPYLRSLSPRPTTLSQEHKFVDTMLKMFSSFWTSLIRSSHSMFWFKFGSKAPLNKLRKLRQWARAWCYEAFEVDWGSWASRCLRNEREASGSNCARSYEDVCLLGEFEVGVEVFVSPNISAWFYPHVQGTRASPRVLLHIEGMVRMNLLYSKRQDFLLKLSVRVI